MNSDTANKTVLKNRFVLEEVLGRGGMGTVFKARDLLAVEARDKDPYLAIKLLNGDLVDDPVFFIAMQREAKKAKSLAHPNIIAIYDFDRDGNHVYLSMELLKGHPLSTVIRQHPLGMPFGKAWPLIRGMAAALSHAHQNGIVHADFKPGNVFVDENGQVKVLDLGIASRFDKPDAFHDDTTVFSSQTLNAYSPSYASLERLNDQPSDPQDDIYALACVVYELLAGKHPFSRSTAQQAYDLKARPAPIASLTKAQWNALSQGLELKKEKRIQSVDQLLRGLAPAAQPKVRRIAALCAAGCVVAGVSAGFIYLAAHFAAEVREEKSQPVAVSNSVKPPVNANLASTIPSSTEHFESLIQPFKLRLSAERFKIGEPMQLFVATEKPMYVTIVHMNSSGEKATLFPNEYETNHLIKPGSEINIPNAEADYAFTVEGPPGTHRIEAIASAAPLPNAGLIVGSNGELDPDIEALIAGRITLEFPVD